MVNSKKEEKAKDAFFYVTVTQCVVAAILIVLLLLSFKNNGYFFGVMAEGYSKLAENDYKREDVSDAFVKLDDYAEAFAQSVYEDTSNTDRKPAGGKDVLFTSVDALEGVCLRDVTLETDMDVPLKNYTVTSHFGYRVSPISGKTGIHTGVDMAAAYGSRIYSAADGTVADAGWDNSYGYYVKILHGKNIVSIYAHCSSLCVVAGDEVKKGEMIAKVGSTGDSTGNHLHFEIRKDNIKINPEYIIFNDEKN